MMTKLMTVVELASFLNTTEKAVYAKVSRGELPYLKFGAGKSGSIRFDPDEISAYLESKRVHSSCKEDSSCMYQ